ncbi:PIN domain-containing protein [Gemmatimonas sp.]|uniref:PIN domain-containing protein n=1 Tax=Gemmatimonas sp. TaxID=1962908 RepID=UPI003562495C
MIALDTNVLVRYLVKDDAAQTALAAALIDRVIAADESLFVSDIVVCETVWVLRVSYRVTRTEVSALLRQLFRARHLRFRAVDQLSRALDAYTTGRGDFADYLIREHARAADCESVATFDTVLVKERGFAAVR